MLEGLKNSILIKLYDKFFENYVIGIGTIALEEEFSPDKPNEVKMVLNELTSEFLVSVSNNQYKITAFGINYLEDENLVNSDKKNQRHEILKILKEFYEEDVDKNVPHEVIVGKLNVSGPQEILSQMKVLDDNGYVHLQMALGGSFWVRLNYNGYKLVKSLS